MASIRLTVGMREDIARRIVAHTFDKKLKVLEERSNQLAAEAYNHMFDPETQRRMLALPTGWLCEADHIRVWTNHGAHTYYFCYADGTKFNKRFPYKAGNRLQLDYNIPRDAAFSDIVQTHQSRYREYHDERKNAYNAAMAVLNSVTTINRAIEVWPEAEEFIKKFTTYGKVNLPAVDMKRLNASLNLPPEEAA